MMGNDRLSGSTASLPSGLGRSAHAGLILALALVAAFAAIALLVEKGSTLAFDEAVLQALRSPADPAHPLGPARLQEMMRDITALGSYGVLGLLVLAVLAYLVLIERPRMALLLAVAVFGGLVASNLLKLGFDRARPETIGAPQVFSASFPSGHAMLSAVIFLTLGAILAGSAPDRRTRIFFIVLAGLLTLIVGLSRIYLGVHYPTDVLAGWCLGAAWSLVCLVAARWIRSRRPARLP